MKIEFVYYHNSGSTRVLVDFEKKTYKQKDNELYDPKKADIMVRVFDKMETILLKNALAEKGFTKTE